MFTIEKLKSTEAELMLQLQKTNYKQEITQKYIDDY